MSSLTIIQEHDRITFAVDTAHCMGYASGKKYRCYSDKVQKIHKAGLDMVFIAGMDECANYVVNHLISFVNKKQHVNLELLKQCLKREFPKEKRKWSSLGLNDIGVIVLSVVNGESTVYCFQQPSNYEPTIIRVEPKGARLGVDGFDNARIYRYAMRYIKTLTGFQYRDPETFVNIYQNNYSEAVGGYIQVYSMTSDRCLMINEHKLEEKNLAYVYSGNDIHKMLIEEQCKNYSSYVHASTFEGGSIFSPDYVPGVSGMKIDLDSGTIDAVNLKVDCTGRITATGANINGTLTSQSDSSSGDGNKVIIEDGTITGRRTEGMGTYYVLSSDERGCIFSNISCDSLNNGTPITTSNKDQFTYPSPGGATTTFKAGDGSTVYVTDGRIVHVG